MDTGLYAALTRNETVDGIGTLMSALVKITECWPTTVEIDHSQPLQTRKLGHVPLSADVTIRFDGKEPVSANVTVNVSESETSPHVFCFQISKIRQPFIYAEHYPYNAERYGLEAQNDEEAVDLILTILNKAASLNSR